MIEFLRGWIINIVIISIFIAILEAIIPNSSFKSYIKMVGGFLIIIALINPFINLLSNDINIDKEFFSYIDKRNDISNLNDNINNLNNEQIEDLYIQNLSSAIDKSLEEKFNYNVENIDIKLLKNDVFKGEIKRLYIYLNKEEQPEKNNENNINIKKVNIGSKSYDNNEVENNLDDKDIKEYLQDEFDIEPKKIHISNRGGGEYGITKTDKYFNKKDIKQ